MPVARFQMPDGRIARFEVPDGTSPEQAQSMISDNIDSLIPAAKKPASGFIERMGGNFSNAIQSGKDLLSGNYQDIGNTSPTPKTEALADKLFPQGYEGGFVDAASNALSNTSPSDWAGAILEKFGETPEGKAMSIIGGLHPLYNAAGVAVTDYVNPAISDVTGIGEDTLALSEMVAGTRGLKKAATIQDPLVSMIKQFPEMIKSQSSLPKDYQPPQSSQPKIDPVITKILDRISKDNPQELQKFLNSYAATKGVSLAEMSGEQTKNLAEGAAQFPSGQTIASDFLKSKTDLAPDALKAAAEKSISPDVAYFDTLDNITIEGRKMASPLYKAAYKNNQSVMTPVIAKILNTPEGKAGLSEAAKNIQNEMAKVAKPDPELTALAKEVSDLGLMDNPGQVAKGLKLQTLDYVKRAMDSNIRKAIRTGDDAESRRISSLKTALVNELDASDKTKAYAKARATSGDYFTLREAMESGADFLRTDPELVDRTFSNLGVAEKKAYRMGVMKAVRDHIDKSTDGRNVAIFMNNQSTRNRLASILAPKDYVELQKTAAAVDGIYKLRNQIVGNSRTALRKQAMDEITDGAANAAMEVMTKGATRTLVDNTVVSIKKAFSGLDDKRAGEVAKILFETDPKKKYQIIKLLNKAVQEKTAYSPIAKRKLEAFFLLSDAINQKKGQIEPAMGAGVQNEQPAKRQPLRLDIPNPTP